MFAYNFLADYAMSFYLEIRLITCSEGEKMEEGKRRKEIKSRAVYRGFGYLLKTRQSPER